MRYFTTLVLLASLGFLLGGCSAPAASPTSSAGPTFGQSADAGKTVYAATCTGCHGASGQGGTAPALIGSGANLGKYTNAQGLLDFMSVSMPFSAPGSLTRQQYLDLLSFLLVQNNYVSAGTAFDSGQLRSIPLTK
jgi:cytochrome c